MRETQRNEIVVFKVPQAVGVYFTPRNVRANARRDELLPKPPPEIIHLAKEKRREISQNDTGAKF